MTLSTTVEANGTELTAQFSREALMVTLVIDHGNSAKAGHITLTDRADVEALYDLLELALCRWPDAEAAEV